MIYAIVCLTGISHGTNFADFIQHFKLIYNQQKCPSGPQVLMLASQPDSRKDGQKDGWPPVQPYGPMAGCVLQ